MRRGLVIGKFMPLHNGHVALINFAASQCEELIVSMSYTLKDPIDPQLRFTWIKEYFKNQPTIKPEISLDDFDNDSLPLPERTQLWAAFIRKRFPPIDVLFSSEEYGKPFAQNLNIPHILFDQLRIQLPVSATLIRQKPFTYWDYIPQIVKPYFVKKICFYGPESTGKSVMAKQMAEYYKTEYVPEVARELITSNEFSLDDIAKIAEAQTRRVLDKTNSANKVLFCDTDLITTQIYSKLYLHDVPSIVYELDKKVNYDLYFLFNIDVPWVEDGLRDQGHRRKEMYGIFKDELLKRNIAFIDVHGTWEERSELIRERINKLLAD